MALRQDVRAAADSGTTNDGRRVIAFRLRPRATAPDAGRGAGNAPGPASPVSDLAKFEQGQEPDNYRHRMIVNTAALVFTVILAAAGVWIAASMAIMRKNQDCVLMGRKSCGEVIVPPSDRWSGSVSQPRQ